jgi:hypothetical protein
MTDWALWLDRLVTAVDHLAAEPVAQKAYLASEGFEGSVDELALEFDDLYVPLAPQLAQLDIPHLAIEKLIRLDELLARMSGPQHAELWEPDALVTSHEWSEVRRLASGIVRDIGV